MLAFLYRFVPPNLFYICGLKQSLPTIWLISLGLHGLLLMIPLPEKLIPKPKERPKPLKVENVKIKDLLATHNKSSPQPAPKPSLIISVPTPSKTTQLIPQISTAPALPLQKPILETTPIPSPTPLILATPTPSPTPTLILTPTPSPTPLILATATPSPIPALKSQTEEVELQSLLTSSGIPTDRQVTPDLFAEPSKFFDKLNPPQLKSDILRTTWIESKIPEQVSFTILQNPTNSNEFQVTELGKYGEGIVYEVKQENSVWYFNFVPTKYSRGTIIVVWKKDPSRLAPAQ